MAVPLTTPDSLSYNFYPLSYGKQIQFRIRAPNDAHICLTTGPYEGDPEWEVFIGGWGNTKSVIRKNRTKPDVVEAATPGFLDANEHRGFWIRWNNGHLTVGKENDPEPFLSFVDPEPFEPTHFGVCTGWGATGEWLIEDQPNPAINALTRNSGEVLGSTCWCDSENGAIPPEAVVGGEDSGEPLFIGRAEHEGAIIPGKVAASHGVCYIAWGGQEHGKSQYQVLCGCSPLWVPVSGSNIPPTAIPAGQSEDGEPLFVGRVNHEGTLTIGKVQPSHNCLYIPFAGQEIPFSDYEILTG